jgi:hypothetical protein
MMALSGCIGGGGSGGSGGDTGDTCGGPGFDVTQSFHDPSSNQCIDLVRRYECDSSCGDCPPFEPLPPYGECESSCTALAEDACLATTGCGAAYSDATQDTPAAFSGCWEIAHHASDNPYETCEAHDAVSCASDDRCAAYYHADAPHDFARCAVEPSA